MYKVTIRLVKSMETAHFYGNMDRIIAYCAPIIIDLTGGFTVDAHSTGYWKNADGVVVRETGHDMWTLCDADAIAPLKELAAELKEYGKQDCVLFIVEEMKAVHFV